MNKTYYTAELKKKIKKVKILKKYPTIKRCDIMSGILSEYATNEEKQLLSIIYFEITKMEMKDMKYITEIAISSQRDAEAYDLVEKLKSKEKTKYVTM